MCFKYGFDSHESGFSSIPPDVKPHTMSSAPLPPVSYGYQNASSSKKIDIPNGRVGVIIGKGGETIKYLQIQSGAKIQVTRDMDADPNSPTRMVELMGTPEQIAKAEQLITDVLSEVVLICPCANCALLAFVCVCVRARVCSVIN
ncbi:hypothetical protein ACB092_05G042300 [Castanea dentata]